jgi:hypothetical protein
MSRRPPPGRRAGTATPCIGYLVGPDAGNTEAQAAQESRLRAMRESAAPAKARTERGGAAGPTTPDPNLNELTEPLLARVAAEVHGAWTTLASIVLHLKEFETALNELSEKTDYDGALLGKLRRAITEPHTAEGEAERADAPSLAERMGTHCTEALGRRNDRAQQPGAAAEAGPWPWPKRAHAAAEAKEKADAAVLRMQRLVIERAQLSERRETAWQRVITHHEYIRNGQPGDAEVSTSTRVFPELDAERVMDDVHSFRILMCTDIERVKLPSHFATKNYFDPDSTTEFPPTDLSVFVPSRARVEAHASVVRAALLRMARAEPVAAQLWADYHEASLAEYDANLEFRFAEELARVAITAANRSSRAAADAIAVAPCVALLAELALVGSMWGADRALREARPPVPVAVEGAAPTPTELMDYLHDLRRPVAFDWVLRSKGREYIDVSMQTAELEGKEIVPGADHHPTDSDSDSDSDGELYPRYDPEHWDPRWRGEWLHGLSLVVKTCSAAALAHQFAQTVAATMCVSERTTEDPPSWRWMVPKPGTLGSTARAQYTVAVNPPTNADDHRERMPTLPGGQRSVDLYRVTGPIIELDPEDTSSDQEWFMNHWEHFEIVVILRSRITTADTWFVPFWEDYFDSNAHMHSLRKYDVFPHRLFHVQLPANGGLMSKAIFADEMMVWGPSANSEEVVSGAYEFLEEEYTNTSHDPVATDVLSYHHRDGVRTQNRGVDHLAEGLRNTLIFKDSQSDGGQELFRETGVRGLRWWSYRQPLLTVAEWQAIAAVPVSRSVAIGCGITEPRFFGSDPSGGEGLFWMSGAYWIHPTNGLVYVADMTANDADGRTQAAHAALNAAAEEIQLISPAPVIPYGRLGDTPPLESDLSDLSD